MIRISKININYQILVAFLIGILFMLATNAVSAHGGDNNLIHSCIKNSTGSIRIVSSTDTCTNIETALDWPKNSVPAFGSFTTNQLVGYASDTESFDYRTFEGGNFTQSNLSSPHMAFANFANTNFTGAFLIAAVVNNSNFTNTLFVNTTLDSVSFVNTNLLGANFSGSIRNNIFWSNSTCPDGTNSDNNGNTCEGHLVP